MNPTFPKSFSPLDKNKNTRKNYLTGFTLLELIIVIIIIGILATVALTQYGGYREGVLDQEAQANLRLILSAERILRMETGTYYQSTGVDAAAHIRNINTNFRLLLSAAANRSWNYQTWATNPPAISTCCAQATRNGAGGRTWRMRNTENDPVNGGACP